MAPTTAAAAVIPIDASLTTENVLPPVASDATRNVHPPPSVLPLGQRSQNDAPTRTQVSPATTGDSFAVSCSKQITPTIRKSLSY
jgi:hypothetical protein